MMKVEPAECGNSEERDIHCLEDLTAHTVQVLFNCKAGTKISEAKELFLQRHSEMEFSHQSVKENIKQLLDISEQEQDTLSELHNETMGGSSHQKVKANITQNQRKKDYAEEEILSLTDNIAHKEQLLKQMEQKEKDATVDNANILPKIKTETETFVGMSHLKWDYNAPDNLVKGVIFRPEKKELCPFEMDRNTQSQFFITNHLWSLIGQDDDFF